MSVATVMIVENDPLNADYLRRELAKMDFEVCTHCTSGEDAVAGIASARPDLILMDISLDGEMDGIEAAARIAATHPTPTIFLSGYTDDATLTRARATKPYGYLVKPITEAALNATLQMLMERLDTERQLQQSQSRLRQAALVFDVTQDGILILDAERRIVRVNRSFSHLTGFTAREIIGQHPYFLDSDAVLTADRFDRIDHLPNGSSWSAQMNVLKHDQQLMPAMVTAAVVRDAQTAAEHYVISISDRTAVRLVESTLYRMAHHDTLTGLPNRQLAMDRLRSAIAQARRHQSHLAVLFIDLDNFKQVNDSYGHNIGDELLRAVASRLQLSVRNVDTVARLGGDEFIVILDDIESEGSAALVAQKMLENLNSALNCRENLEISAYASIGIALFPEAGTTPEQLVQAADYAMYEAKSNGRNCYALFSPLKSSLKKTPQTAAIKNTTSSAATIAAKSAINATRART